MKLITLIDGLLPQTQCTKCGYEGCKPYAEAMAKGEAINKCPPGGQETLLALAALLDREVVPLESGASSPAQVAFIREEECIGCTKCIQACPVDAIVGAAKFMHTVIAKECSGCELCVVPCPVDCIEMRPLPDDCVALTGDSAQSEEARLRRQVRRDHARQRFEFRLNRLSREKAQRQQSRGAALVDKAKPVEHKGVSTVLGEVMRKKGGSTALSSEQKRLKIELAMAKVALGKAQKQWQQYGTAELAVQVKALEEKVAITEQTFQQSLGVGD